MTRLLVRNLDPEIAQTLKRQAVKHGRSAEAEHREILKQALPGPSFAQMLASIQNIGKDSDFERGNDPEADSIFN